MNDIQVGDVVYLKNNILHTMVVKDARLGYCWCIWFNNKGELRKEDFPYETLRKQQNF